MNYEIFMNKFLRKTLASWCAFATLATMCGPAFAASGSYFGGAAVLTRTSDGVTATVSANDLNINGNANNVLDWQKLNVPAANTMNFGAGTFYNVVSSDGGMSTIAGAIKGQNNVYIFNPNGVVFNSGSSVDVGGIFGAFATGVSGTTLNDWISNPTDVPDAIKNATMSGEIEINGGTFKASQLAFAGENVRVNGGTFKNATTLAAGDRVTIDGFGDGTISLTVPNADYGDIEFDGVSTFADALVAKAGGSVNVGNNSEVTVNGANGLDVAAEAFHVDNSKVDVTAGKLTAQVSDRIAVMGTSSVHAKGDLALTVTDGNVAIADGSAASVKSEANVAITANGGDITMDKGGEIVGQNVTLNATGTGSHKDISMVAGSTITAKGALAVTTANGSVTEDAGAKILATDNATFTAKEGDITLAGEKNDFSKGGVASVVNAEAKNVTINEGGTVSGDNTGISLGTVKATAGNVKVTDTTGTITAKAATVDATKYVELAATETGRGIAISDGAKITADNKVKLTTASATGDVTIDGEGTLVKAGRFDVDPATGEVKNQTAYGILVIDSKHDVKITDGAQAGANGYATLGNAVAVNIDAANDVTVNNATLAGNKRVLIDAAKTVTVENGARVLSNYDITIGAEKTPETLKVTDNGTQLAAKGDVTADAGAITIENNAKVASDKSTALTAKTGDIAVKSAAKVLANEHVALVAANDVAIGDAATANDTSVTAGENIRIESKNGAIDIVSKVTAGKNLTIVSEKATAGSKVKIDAQYLTDKKILTAEDGSIYVAAEANDVELNNGAIVTATDSTGTDPTAAGNILLKSESGSVTPAEGTATIIADDGKGVAALVGGGTVGNKNLTIKAGVTVLNSTGKGVDTPDVKAVFEGDTKLVANAVHDVDVDIVGGTLTIDSQANALAGENVNEVKYTPSDPVAVTLEKHELKAYANDSRGVEAGNDIKITGQNANLVIANNSSVLAGNDITVNIDGNETVLGAMQAGNNIAQNIGGNITVSGTEAAGNDITETIGGNSDVSGAVQAGRDITETIAGNFDVSGTVKAGRDVKSDVKRDTTISGTMEAENDAFVRTDWNLSTPGGKIVAGKDLFVRVGTSTPMINIAVGKGVSAVSGERSIAFRTVGGYEYPEVYGNNSDTAVFIDGRVAGGNSADFSMLQGYEQVGAFGNILLTPVFTYAANFFPLLNFTDMQSPAAAFAQGYLSSDKGTITEMGEAEAE